MEALADSLFPLIRLMDALRPFRELQDKIPFINLYTIFISWLIRRRGGYTLELLHEVMSLYVRRQTAAHADYWSSLSQDAAVYAEDHMRANLIASGDLGCFNEMDP